MYLLQLPYFPLHLPVSQKAKGGRHSWEILRWSQRQSLLMKLFLTGIHIQEAVTGHLLADFCFKSPQCCPGNFTYLKWKAQNVAAVKIRLWALTPSWAHLWSCRMFTSMVVLGDLSWFFERPVWKMKASVRFLCPVGRSDQRDLERQWKPRNSCVFSGQISL